MLEEWNVAPGGKCDFAVDAAQNIARISPVTTYQSSQVMMMEMMMHSVRGQVMS